MSIRYTLAFIWEVAKIVIIALAIVVPIRTFLFQPFIVKGASMEPNFHSGDYLVVDELSYNFRTPERGEVIIFRYPGNPSQRYIKRVIGLPGERLEIANGTIEIYPQNSTAPLALNESAYLPGDIETSRVMSINLEADQYFVMGDNRPFSSDSRSWGPIKEADVIGKILVRAWPLNRLSTF